jgi:energy-converting hydrogenase Eha subunit A
VPVFRLLLILSALSIVTAGVLYLFTRDSRFLRFAWQVVYFLITTLLALGAMFLLERFALVGWRILL